MNCPIQDHNSEMLVAYTAGQLDQETVQELGRHLAGCAACRSMAAEQAAVWKALDAWEAPAVSPDFDRRLCRRIEQGARLSWWERLVRPFRSMPLRQAFPLTASAGLLLTAALLLQHPGSIVPAKPRGDLVRANQVEKTLDDLDLLRQFSAADSAESGHPHVM
jgi:anti-sigma factor RsiW